MLKFHNPFTRWTKFELCLFTINFAISLGFFIYGCVKPDFVYNGNHTLAYIINPISFVANVANIFSIILSAKKHISTFFWGVIGCLTLGAASFVMGATCSWILYLIVQLPLQFVGLYNWRKHSSDKIKVNPKSMTWIWRILIAIGVIIGVVGFTFIDSIQVIRSFLYPHEPEGNNWLAFAGDAGNLVIGIVAMILMVLAYKEQWILWLCLDIFCIILWSANLNPQLLIMTCVALINGVYGVFVWYRKQHHEN